MVLFSNKYSNFKNSIIDVVSKIDLKDTNYVPQGICYSEGYYFLTMYDFTKKTNSVLWIYKDGDIYKKINLDNKYHCGGISYDEGSQAIFITGKGENNHSYVQKYGLQYLLYEFKEDELKCKDSYEVDYDNSLYSSAAKHSSPSYLTCYDGYLIVGNYCTCSDLNKCFIKKFKILKDGSISKSFDIIKNPFSNTQSICVFKYNGEILYLFSRSFGRKRNSLIHVCRLVNSDFVIISTMVLPAMLEQVSLCDNNLVLIFESCSKLFRNTSITVNDKIYLISLDNVLSSRDNYKDFCNGSSIFTSNSKYKY